MRLLPIALPAAAVVALAAGVAAAHAANAVRIDATAVPWAVAGDAVAVKGTVTPHPPGLGLTLEQRRGTGWLAVGSAAVGAGGAFSFRARPARVGVATYRVVTAPGSAATGTSGRVPVRVLHWVYVDSVPTFEYAPPLSGEVTSDPISSAGVRYDHPVSLDAGCYNQWGGDAWVDYTLQRQYEAFSATVGLDDSAPSGQTATYSVVGGDGRKLASGTLVTGSATKVEVSLAGEYRLRLRINVPDPTNAAGCASTYTKVVFGDAELLGP